VSSKAFLDKIMSTIRRHRLFVGGERVLVALSGGPDSVVLLHSLLQLRPSLSIEIEAAHFNHGIRGAESDRDQSFVEALAESWGVHLEVGKGDVLALAQKRKKGLEEAAREARYAFLREVMAKRGLQVLAVAHTLSDAVETFFMRLIKGASPYGLKGILPRSGDTVRPMIEVTREEVERYCEEEGLPFVEDSSNKDINRFRNWVRWRLLPLLKEQNPKIEEAVARFMEIMREESQYMEEQVREVLKAIPLGEGQECEVSKDFLSSLPVGLRKRVLLGLIHSMGGDAQWNHLKDLNGLLKGNGEAEVHLPGGLKAVRDGESIRFTQFKEEPKDAGDQVLVFGPGLYALGEYLFHFVELGEEGGVVVKSPWSLLLDRKKVEFPMIIRYKRAKDKIFLNKVGHKKLQDLFVDAKLPRRERSRRPVLVDALGRVLWVPGLRWDARVVANEDTRHFLLVTVKRSI